LNGKFLSINEVYFKFNPLNAELNPICHLLALLGNHPILHVNRIRVKVYKSVHHHTVSNKSTNLMKKFIQFITDIYLQLNMFWVSSRPSSGAQQLQ
jgi:hypothetical protein